MKRTSISTIALVAAMLEFAPLASAQQPPVPVPSAPTERFRIEVEGGIGYTSVDRRVWAGANPHDWEQMLSMGNVRLFFPSLGPVRFGVEAGYRYYWWYEVPYNTYYIEHDVEATQVSAIARLALGRFFSFDLGSGVAIFDDFTDWAIDAALRAQIPLGSWFALLLGPRIGVVLDSDTNLVPIAFTTALALKL